MLHRTLGAPHLIDREDIGADQSFAGVDPGIAIDFGGLLNAAVGRRRLCNSSTQSSPSRRLSALAMFFGRAGKLAHQDGYLVRILDPRLVAQAGVAGMWRFTAATST